MLNNFLLSTTLELRKIGSNYCLYRQSDRIAWEVDIAKFEEFWSVLELLSDPDFNFELGIDENTDYVLRELLDNNIIQRKEDISKFELLNSNNSNTTSYAYHLSSSRIEWTNYSDKESIKDNDLNEMDHYVREEETPSNYKKHSSSEPRYCLEEYIKITDIEKGNIFGKNKTHNLKTPNIEDLNLVINNTFKQTNIVNMYATGSHIRKNVPSGGARHPIELYLLILDVHGVKKGIYHYNVKFHRLDEIALSEDELETVANTVNIIPRGRNKKLVASFIHSCIFKRSMFRYREPRSYRVMHFDLGHIHANECIVSNLLKLSFCETYSIQEDILENLLGLDGYSESIMSAMNFYGV